MSESTVASTTSHDEPGIGWGWLLAAGIATVLISMFMFVYPAAASVAVTLFIGWSLLFAGVFGVASGIANRRSGAVVLFCARRWPRAVARGRRAGAIDNRGGLWITHPAPIAAPSERSRG